MKRRRRRTRAGTAMSMTRRPRKSGCGSADLAAPPAAIVDALTTKPGCACCTTTGSQSVEFESFQPATDVIRIDVQARTDVFERERPVRVGAPDPAIHFVEVAAMLRAWRIQSALERDERLFEHGEHQAVTGARGHFRSGLIGYERKICCC